MEFDINKVFTAANAEQVKIGSVGYFANSLNYLKDLVLSEKCSPSKVTEVKPTDYAFRFNADGCKEWNLFYLVEEPPAEELCTRRELARWLAQGRGEFKYHKGKSPSCNYCYTEEFANAEVVSTCRVRKWEETEWQVPTRKYMGLE